MGFNALIHRRLSECQELSDMLAKYAGQPAIFNTEFPSDQQEGWEGQNQYPRISYRMDMQVNQERSSVGTLHVSIYTQKNYLLMERLECLVRRSLKDILMKPKEQAPFCVSWARTEPYLLDGMAVICKDVVFDILEYPAQETTDPDPVMAMAVFVKRRYPDAVVMGLDQLAEYTDPANRPVFYCRLEGLNAATGHCINTISWFHCRLAVHLLCPDAEIRLKMIAAVHQRLAMDTEVIMLDDSPMTIQELAMNNKADYLREGQLVVTGRYGCLRGGEKKHTLSGAGMAFMN